MKSKSHFRLSYLIILSSTLFIACKKETPAPLPFADFQVTNSGCTSPCWVHFYDNSLNAVSWEWDFGNNFNSTTQHDSMLYNSFGFYDVKLVVKNLDGVADSVIKEIMVY